MHRWLALCVLLALSASAAAPATAATSRSAPRATSPKALVLGLKDIGSGYYVQMQRFYTNAQAEKADNLAPGTFTRHGRITSYERDFSTLGKHAIQQIDSRVAVFKNVAGAHWSFAYSVSQARKSSGGFHWTQLASPRVGDESIALRSYLTVNKKRDMYIVVISRRSAYVASVIAGGAAGKFSTALVNRLAQIMDTKIRAAH